MSHLYANHRATPISPPQKHHVTHPMVHCQYQTPIVGEPGRGPAKSTPASSMADRLVNGFTPGDIIQFGSITFIVDRSGDLHQLCSAPVRPRIVVQPSTTPEQFAPSDRRHGPTPRQHPPTPREVSARRHEAPAPRQNLPPRRAESDRAPRGHHGSRARTNWRVPFRAGSTSTTPA